MYYKKKANLKMKALEPKEMFCTLIKKKVVVLIEYWDYKSRYNKGNLATLYCSNMVECYHKERKCKYSGISPNYPDPLVEYSREVELYYAKNKDKEEKDEGSR